MKILVLSLLRIGDTFMHLKVIQGLKQKFPNSQISIVINDDFQQMKPLLEQELHAVHLFPRKKLQQLINQRESHLLEPLWLIQDWTRDVSAAGFDQVYNFTHTRSSALVMGLIRSPKKLGLCIENDKVILNGTEWLNYFNNHFPSGSQSDFHLIEVLSRAFALPLEVEKYHGRDSRQILLQPLTSDAKKNWPLAHWRKLHTLLSSQLPDYKINVLSAPGELSLLMQYFSQDSILVQSFTELRESLKTCELLVCGDTSAAHLATLTNTKSLMISLGSSDAKKTGPFLRGSAVLSGEAPCRPCNHTQTCSQVSQLCADGITASIAAHYAIGVLKEADLNGLNFPHISFSQVEIDSQTTYKLQAAKQTNGGPQHGEGIGPESRKPFGTATTKTRESLQTNPRDSGL